VIKSGNHLLTQVKDNQPGLRRKLELGSAGRKPRDSAQSVTEGRNRHETRRLEVFDAKAWFARTPWEPLIKTVLRLTRIVHRRDAATGLWTTSRETVSGSHRRQLLGKAMERLDSRALAHRERQPSRARHNLRRGRVAHPQEPDIAARLRSFAYNLLRAHGSENIKNARWRAALDLDFLLDIIAKY